MPINNFSVFIKWLAASCLHVLLLFGLISFFCSEKTFYYLLFCSWGSSKHNGTSCAECCTQQVCRWKSLVIFIIIQTWVFVVVTEMAVLASPPTSTFLLCSCNCHSTAIGAMVIRSSADSTTNRAILASLGWTLIRTRMAHCVGICWLNTVWTK